MCWRTHRILPGIFGILVQKSEDAKNGQYPRIRTRNAPVLTSEIQANPIEGDIMTLGTVLLIVLVLMLIGTVPAWPHSRGWGYGPSGGLGLVFIILLVLVLTGRF